MGKGDGLYNLIAFSVVDPQPRKMEGGQGVNLTIPSFFQVNM